MNQIDMDHGCMNLTLVTLVLCSVCVCVLAVRKAVKIVQEPANFGGMQAQQLNRQNSPKLNEMLKPFKKPENFSGPSHLRELYGKCFSLTDNSYRYQLCPFFNITQHEQTWRWNAFQGILGIWKEWSIVNNTLEAMIMTEGDSCPGGIRRQSKIFLKCANKNKLVTVTEPNTCQYQVEFQTPLACPVDAFLVYPLLSREHQNDWLEIERSFYHKEVTKQGYEKLRRKLFIRAGLMIPDKPKDPKPLKESSQDQTSTKTSLDAHSEFRTKDECSKAYSELMQKYKRLVQLHQKNNPTSYPKTNNSQISNANNFTRARGDHGTIK